MADQGRRWLRSSLIIAPTIDPGEPGRPGPARQGRSSSGALHLDPWGQARSPDGRVDGRRDDQQDRCAQERIEVPVQGRALRTSLASSMADLVALGWPSGGPYVALMWPSGARDSGGECRGFARGRSMLASRSEA